MRLIVSVFLMSLMFGCQSEHVTTGLDATPAADLSVSEDEDAQLDVGLPRDAAARMDAGPQSDLGALDMRVTDGGIEEDLGSALDGSSETQDGAVAVADAALDPGDAEANNGPSCPESDGDTVCLFGATSRVMVDDQTLQILQGVAHESGATMTPLEREQLLLGFTCEGIFMPATVDEAFDDIDEGGVRMYRVRRVNPDGLYTWLRFFMGDTEVGYLFREGTLELVAIVSDQDIVRCVEPRGDNPPMTCGQLDECLQGCDLADIECRRPCIRSTEQEALEAYISLDECRSDCGADEACLARVCGDERAACFGQ